MISVLLWVYVQLPLRDVQALTGSRRDHGWDWCVEKALLRGGATFGCGQGRLKTKNVRNEFIILLYVAFRSTRIAWRLRFLLVCVRSTVYIVLTCCRLMSVSGETGLMKIMPCDWSGVWACVWVQGMGLGCSAAGTICVAPCVLWIRARFCRVKLRMEGFGLTRWVGRWTGNGDGVNSWGEGAIEPANHKENK